MSKKTVARIVIAGLLAAPLMALAQAPSGSGHGACAQQGGMQQGGMHVGRGMGALRGLDLTQEQRDQVFALMHGQMPTQRAKAQELHKAMSELHQLSAAERFDADKARTLSETVGKLQAEKALMRSEMQARMRSVLTPEQRKKLDERKDRHSGHSDGQHPGGRRHS